MSSSRAADTYEAQNNQELESLHTKLRTLRGVTTDIYDDVERQNVTLDETGNSFSTFAGSLAQSSRRAASAFGPEGSLRKYRLLVQVVGAIVAFWFGWHVVNWIFSWFRPS
ncbi:hypothetical protein BU17DRAFT_43357 [Hysterangium stoloniferum]|nr:hypothetical protein BU17DRAFT_43357 [Hysterangium stoloniferum]